MGAPTIDVEGQKEIAALLGRSVGAVKRYAAREVDPLPMYAFLGRIGANRAELLAWRDRQTKATSSRTPEERGRLRERAITNARGGRRLRAA